MNRTRSWFHGKKNTHTQFPWFVINLLWNSHKYFFAQYLYWITILNRLTKDWFLVWQKRPLYISFLHTQWMLFKICPTHHPFQASETHIMSRSPHEDNMRASLFVPLTMWSFYSGLHHFRYFTFLFAFRRQVLLIHLLTRFIF